MGIGPGRKNQAAAVDFAGGMRHSDKSFLDKPHFSICDEAAAGALSKPPSARVLMLFLMARILGFSKKNFSPESVPPLLPTRRSF